MLIQFSQPLLPSFSPAPQLAWRRRSPAFRDRRLRILFMQQFEAPVVNAAVRPSDDKRESDRRTRDLLQRRAYDAGPWGQTQYRVLPAGGGRMAVFSTQASHTQASQKAPSGIVGLDDVLGGGFTRGCLFLLEGMPGTARPPSRCASSCRAPGRMSPLSTSPCRKPERNS